MALFLVVMCRLVKRRGKREPAAGGVTSQMPEASLARRFKASLTKQDSNSNGRYENCRFFNQALN